MDVIKFEIEESKVNKGSLILIAITEDNKKFVVGGNSNDSRYLIPYEKCFDAIGEKKFREISGLK